MKFGQQLEERSVPQWRHNNIDYAQLKQAIKRATTPTGNDEQDRSNLDKLTALFEEQFKAVNLFTTLKVREYSSRILGVESLIISYTQKQLHDDGTTTQAVAPLGGTEAILGMGGSLRAIRSSANKCSRELKLFSRYLILQQVATRKLFKKFTKYYQGGSEAAKEYIGKLKESRALKSGYDGISYMSLDLDPYLLEVSLIFDVLHDLEAKTTLSNVDSIQSTLVTTNRSSQQFMTQHSPLGSAMVAPLRRKKRSTRVIKSRLEFDKLFLSECETVQRLLLTSENTEEFKFVLLSLKYQVFDDQIISVSKDIVDTTEQIRRMPSRPSIRSMQSFSSLTNYLKPLQPFAETSGPTSPRLDNRSPSISIPGPNSNMGSRSGSNAGLNLISATSTLSMDLLIPPLHKQATSSQENGGNDSYNLLRDLLSDELYNQHPNIVLRDQNESGCVVMCHVGGLRDHAATETLPLGFINYELSRNNYGEKSPFEKNDAGLSGFPLTPINKLIVEWIQLNHLVVVDPKVTFRRTRFISYDNVEHSRGKDPTDGGVYIYMVTLDENISIVIDGETGVQTLRLPHSFVEIKRLKSDASGDVQALEIDQATERSNGKIDSQLAKLCGSLVESRIQCYPLLSSCTFWSVTSRLFAACMEGVTPGRGIDSISSDEIQYKLYSIILGDEYIVDGMPEGSISRIKFFKIGQEKTLHLCSASFRRRHKEMAYDYREEEENEEENKEPRNDSRGGNGEVGAPYGSEPRNTLVGKPPQNDQLSRESTPKRMERIRYWNEFDDEEARFNDENFYVDEADSAGSSDGTMYNDNGFIKLDRHFVDWMFDACQSLRHTFRIPMSLRHGGMNTQQQSQALLLAHLRGPSYGTSSLEEQDASDNRRLLELQEQEMNEAASVFEFRHDKVISFMYLFAVIVAFMSSGVSLIIVLQLFRGDTDNFSVDHMWLLISIIVVSLSISLLLACGALLLLFSRFSLAPWWHYIACFLVFLLVTCSVCYGILEIFI